MILTKVQEEDLPALIKILNDATNYKLSLGDTSWGSDPWTKAEIQGRIDDGCDFYLAKIEDETVGAVAISEADVKNWGSKPNDSAYVHHLAVAGGYHNKGFGEQIIDSVAEMAARDKKQYIRLDCHPNNEGLCRYYEEIGFTKVGSSTKTDNEGDGYKAALYQRSVFRN